MEVEHSPDEKIRTCSIHVKVTGKEKRVTNCAAICGKSPILPVVNSAVKAKEITDNTNRDLIMRNISKRKETKNLLQTPWYCLVVVTLWARKVMLAES